MAIARWKSGETAIWHALIHIHICPLGQTHTNTAHTDTHMVTDTFISMYVLRLTRQMQHNHPNHIHTEDPHTEHYQVAKAFESARVLPTESSLSQCIRRPGKRRNQQNTETAEKAFHLSSPSGRVGGGMGGTPMGMSLWTSNRPVLYAIGLMGPVACRC